MADLKSGRILRHPSPKKPFTMRALKLLVFGLSICFSQAKCPNIPAEKLFPCFCLHDTNEIYCRGAEGNEISDDVLSRVMMNIADASQDPMARMFSKLTITQTEITNLNEKLFKNLKFDEIAIRYNFRLRTIHKDTFADSRINLKNVSFGEVGSVFETRAMTPFNLDFLKGMKLENVFLNGLNLGHLEESIFKPLLPAPGKEPLTQFFVSNVIMDCGCKIKWLYQLDFEQRRPLVGENTLVGPRTTPLSCNMDNLAGMLPLRALSLADFKKC